MAHKSLRHRPEVDMTPMVDLGFLLVTFFMMTTQFSPAELTKVTAPAATSEDKLPEANNAVIVVSSENKVFFRMDGVKHLKALGEKLNDRYKLGLTQSEIESFSHQTGFGLPFSQLKQYLTLSNERQKSLQGQFQGIPVGTGSEINELTDWIIFARIVNNDARLVVKGDKATNYPVIKKVMDTLQACIVNKFYLITDTKEKPKL
jgi:biopolymer transport protein ExbD